MSCCNAGEDLEVIRVDGRTMRHLGGAGAGAWVNPAKAQKALVSKAKAAPLN